MNKHIFSMVLFVFCFLSVNAVANNPDSVVPEPFQRFDANSILALDYTDLDSLLATVVLNTGRSNREKAPPSRSQTGTRMKVTVNRSTIYEGNRFFFEIFENNEENQQTLRNIQNRLENLPTSNPLEKYSRDEQLAYWLNLYNVTILNEIVKVYPERELEDVLVGNQSALSKKILSVAGVPLSLNDIQFTILGQNYDNNPLIIYGLYQGIIGGPNIRKSAYTGRYVYGDLIDNAMEFVNSNRGTESKNKRTFRVSSLYQRNQLYFPDFNSDLSRHLLRYLEGEERGELQGATKIKADINDWTTTDLYGNTRDVGGSFANSSAALIGAASGNEPSRFAAKSSSASKYSPAVMSRLQELNQKREQEDQPTGVVTIEEMGEVTDKATGRN